MSVGDDVWQGVVSSMVSDSYTHNDEVLSPEDIEWVDSCIVKDPELSDSTWDAMQDALLEILSSETPLGNDSPVAINDGFQRQSTMDSPMNKEAQVTQSHVKNKDDHIPSFLAMQDALRDILGSETRDILSSETRLGYDSSDVNDEFQIQSTMDSLMSEETQGMQSPVKKKDDRIPPNSVQYIGETDYNYPPITGEAEIEQFRSYILNPQSNLRGLKRGKKAEAAPDLSFTNETEFPLEDIFKVWDLNIPLDEEDELVKQLEKALGEGSLSTEPLVHDDSISDLDSGAVDDLISGIADLSLSPLSSS